MKKIIIVALISGILYSMCGAKCINAKHRKSQLAVVAGQQVTTATYQCAVRSSEVVNFDDGYCRNCGCHVSDHDNT